MRPNIVSVIEMVKHVMISVDVNNAKTRSQEEYHNHFGRDVSVERVDVQKNIVNVFKIRVSVDLNVNV